MFTINSFALYDVTLETEEAAIFNLLHLSEMRPLLSYISRFQADDQDAKALSAQLKEKDIYTYEHSQRVMNISLSIASTYGFSKSEIKSIYYAAILHDIGKLSVPEHIIKKPGKLTPEEWMLIYRHPVISERLVKLKTSLTDSLPAIRHHHERYDGSGYPDGRNGDKIPLAARIIAVADTFDAVTSSRPYQKAVPVTVAIKTIQEGAGTQFDPHVVKAFNSILCTNSLNNN